MGDDIDRQVNERINEQVGEFTAKVFRTSSLAAASWGLALATPDKEEKWTFTRAVQVGLCLTVAISALTPGLLRLWQMNNQQGHSIG